jgi:hypothetical protein
MNKRTILYLMYGAMLMMILFTAAVLVVPRILWSRMDSMPLNVWIVDKTVTEEDYKEHEGLMWALNRMKIVSPDSGGSFRYDRDYYGTFPEAEAEFSVRPLPEVPAGGWGKQRPDLIYLADTYGRYQRDEETRKEDEAWTEPKLLYGGLSDDELDRIISALGEGTVLIGEYDIIRHTSRQRMEELFGLSLHTGYHGKYFKELSRYSEIPRSIVQNYETQTGRRWDFEGSGIVLISGDDRITILRKERDFKGDELSFRFTQAAGFAGIKEIPYDGWFEIVAANPSTRILGEYTVDLTEEGSAAMEKLGLPSVFPAVIEKQNSRYTSYYFAGDYAQKSFNGEYPGNYGSAVLRRILSLRSESDSGQFYWKAYLPMMEKILTGIDERKAGAPMPPAVAGAPILNVRVSGQTFEFKKDDGAWSELFARGVNIGSSLPGKWFTEFVRSEQLFIAWFEKISAMGANTIRVYTLLAPEFYSALQYYNTFCAEQPLLLYQEIWPEENPADGDYLAPDYEEEYRQEIRYVIDAMHGRAVIPQRDFRAYGLYTSDISPYIAGYLVGRELEPEEVIQTDERNPGYTFRGEYLFTEPEASPTEAWLAMNCDYVAAYETLTYGWQHPVGIVSWPTLDPAEHDSEWNAAGDKNLEYNDKAVVDINHISVKESLEAGFFGAYHIYPNYPDFMNNEAAYDAYSDEEGRLRYGGYLQEFIEGHTRYPALVAEFGLATGMGNAHYSPDGYHHGGMTEKVQGEGVVRMMKAIRREGYAGGLIFEWSDEWAKKTWTTEPYIIPFERNPQWHSAIDPEQNYGILAMEPEGVRSEAFSVTGRDAIRQLELAVDEAFLQVRIRLSEPLDLGNEMLIIGLDTYDRAKGETKYGAFLEQNAPSGLEFLVELRGEEDASLLVHPGYNFTKGLHRPSLTNQGIFERMSLLINKERVTKGGAYIPAVYDDLSALRFGSLDNNTYYHWESDGETVTLRLPWGRLHFSDPSSMRVLDDPGILYAPQRDELGTAVSEGLVVSALLTDAAGTTVLGRAGVDDPKNLAAFRWKNWEMPLYREREKSSYQIISDYFFAMTDR